MNIHFWIWSERRRYSIKQEQDLSDHLSSLVYRILSDMKWYWQRDSSRTSGPKLYTAKEQRRIKNEVAKHVPLPFFISLFLSPTSCLLLNRCSERYSALPSRPTLFTLKTSQVSQVKRSGSGPVELCSNWQNPVRSRQNGNKTYLSLPILREHIGAVRDELP